MQFEIIVSLYYNIFGVIHLSEIVSGIKLIFGVDILPFSSPSSTLKLALVKYFPVTDDVSIVSSINLLQLIQMIRKDRPEILALDNLFELAVNSDGIIKIAQKIPETKIVQVTGSPKDGLSKIVEIARRNKFWKGGKPNPEETALLAAKLAASGVGSEVVCFESELRALVTRVKSKTSKGGWSQQRYDRNIIAAIKNTSSSFKEELRKNELNFDLYSYGSRTVYIIEIFNKQQRNLIKKIAKELTGSLAGIFIKNVPKENLEYIPLSGKQVNILQRSSRGVIVGIDPGTTTGIAILDLWNGKILHLKSKREYSTSQIVSSITDFGRAIIVSSDVRPAPYLVKKISRIFGAKLVSPTQKQPSRSEKREISQKYLEKNDISISSSDNHSRDALFAAIKAFTKYSVLIDKIKQGIAISTELKDDSFISICQIAIIDETNINEAIKSVEEKYIQLNKPEAEEQPKRAIQTPQNDVKIASYETKIIKYRIHQNFLENELEEQKEKLNDMKKKRNKLLKQYNKYRRKISFQIENDKRIKEKNSMINHLHQKIAQLTVENTDLHRKLETIGHVTKNWTREEYIPLKPLEKLSEDCLINSEKILGLYHGDIILLMDPTGGGTQTANILVDRKIRALIIPTTSSNLSHQAREVLEFNEIPIIFLPVINFNEYITNKKVVKKFETLYFITKKVVDELIYNEKLVLIKRKAEFLKKLEKEAQKKKLITPSESEKTENQIVKLIDDYRIRRDNWLGEPNYENFDEEVEEEDYDF